MTQIPAFLQKQTTEIQNNNGWVKFQIQVRLLQLVVCSVCASRCMLEDAVRVLVVTLVMEN